MSSTTDNQAVAASVNQWLDDVVIGLNLCPFAAKPQRNQQIKICVSNAAREEDLLQDILDQLLELDTKEPQVLETTLVVVPDMLQDFTDYNFFIDWVEALIRQQDWEGVFQVATFHPNYYFAGTEPEDAENLTNRAPYPIFHLIREESMEKVLKHYPNPEAIPDTNIERVSNLTEAERKALFPYLFR
ncbi:DUF1415 domain-containing protein [Vibrio fluvialis]|nr:DUF1415 domain-containing protein [Vibrio fluvialis]EKO3451641.1 DUF1415 domain-containing protein [Vibrio fluvialis]EKO3461374.1 DUF1415 domain-containing protein [Vibrio fluvialis]EKO5152303.1 DUF1415 domain-containing protein [Vibrio fluvialis]ELO4021744.1 DUF1415 domain-containing protein [Vibrio fluvialis]